MINLKDISTKDLFLELLSRSEVYSERAYSPYDNTAYDWYQIKIDFHLTDEEWNEHTLHHTLL